MKNVWILAVAPAFIAGVASAQVAVDVSGYGVNVQSGNSSSVNVKSGSSSSVNVKSGGNTAVNVTGIVDSDVQMEGIAVINGNVFIDGVKVPKGQTVYISKKTKKTYHIQWGKDGNVNVTEK